MRYRFQEQNSSPVTVVRRVRTRGNCSSAYGSWSVQSSATWRPSDLKKEIWDVEILDFKALRKKCPKGLLPINPVTIRTTSVERVSGDTAHYFDGTASCPTLREVVNDSPVWAAAGWLVTVPPFDDSLINAVKLNAIAQLRAASYDALTDLLEVRKSVALFSQLASKMDSFLNAMVALTRAKVRTLAKRGMKISLGEVYRIFTQIAAENWLKYRYGVMPIVYSLEAALKNQKGLKGGLIRERAVRSEQLEAFETLNWAVNANTDASTTQTVTGTRIYRATAFGRVDVDGLGSFDPLVSAYETLKFSWILDWLIDVGSYLQAISPFAHVTTKAVCISVKTVVERRQSYSLNWHNAGSLYASGSFDGAQTIETIQEYQRWAEDTSVPWPVWNPRLNIPRITDLLALVIGLKRGLDERLLRI